MGSFSTPFIEKTKEYVAGFIGENFSEKICYHNIDHSIEVVEAAELIGNHCEISDKDLETVIIASWFHDTGYYLGCKEHEIESSKIAQSFLSDENVSQNIINKVINCILSTKVPQLPKSLLEKIICDADLYHLSSDNFLEKSELLLHEFRHQKQDISLDIWLKQSIEFISNHEYHTSYGKKILAPLANKNILLLQAKVREI